MKGKVFWVVGISAVMLLACTTLALSIVVRSSDCSSPIFFGYASDPRLAVSRMNQLMGGFPKTSGEFPKTGLIYPINNWQIGKVRVSNTFPLWRSILDDDPTYGLEIEIRVDYADGDKGLLRLSTWRYGLLLCPVVLGYGDGPPGRIEVISLN